MQDINLLQNKLKDKTNQWEKTNRYMVLGLSLVLLIEVGVGVFFYLANNTAIETKAKLDQENITLASKLRDMEEDLGDAKGLQAQGQNIAALLSTHVGWNDLFTELASAVYRTSQIFRLSADTTGIIHLEGQAANYADVGRALQSLETADEFTSVRLLSTSPSSNENPGVVYSVDISTGQDIFLNQD